MLKKLSRCILGIMLCVCVMLCSMTPALASIMMITKQPQSTAVLKGEMATVTIGVKGDGIRYEWWYAAADTEIFTKSDVTGNAFSVEMNESNNGLKVYCVLSDAYNHTAQTKTVRLYLITPLEIISQPQDDSALAGDMVSTAVEAIGDELAYAWWVRGADETEFKQSAVTTPAYELIMDDAHAGMQAYCVITDKYGESAQTDTVTFKRRTPLVITQQPQSTMAAEGATAEVTVALTGDEVTYAWWVAATEKAPFKNSGVTTNTYAVTMDSNHDGELLFCVVSDMYGNTLQSETVKISMLPPLEIITQPQDGYAYDGEIVCVTVEAMGEDVTYAWWFANANTSEYAKGSVTEAEYSVEMNDVRAGRKVYCVVTDKYGQTVQSDTVQLIMKTPLVITQQPAHMSVVEGQEAVVSFAAQGDGMTYAWYVTDENGNFAADACTEAQYAFVMDASKDGLQAYCVVTDAYGITVQTESVMVNLIPAGLSYEIREGAAVVTGYAGDETHLQIPAVIEGCQTREIAAQAFASCTQLQQITLPESVASIGEGAFMGCEELTVINLPQQLTTVGSSAFAGCGKLQCIVVPEEIAALDAAWFGDVDKELLQFTSKDVARMEAWASETGFAFEVLREGQIACIAMPRTLDAIRGEQYEISYTVYFINGETKEEVIAFASSAEDIATVDENGLVTVLGAGSAIITATAENGTTATCAINSVCGTHEEEMDAAVAATCIEDGLTEGKHCSACGEVLVNQKIVAALGHTEETDAAVAPSCTEDGLTEGKHCSVCGEVLVNQEVVAALGHTEETDAAVAATCTEDGLTEGKHCTVCGEVLVKQEIVAALGHTEETDAAVAATCTEDGLTEGKHCTVCSEVLVKQEIVAALGHTEETDAAVAATCTEDGLTEGKHCTVCGEVLVKQEVVAALGHTEVIDEAVAAENGNDGLTEGKHCSACGEVLVKQEVIVSSGVAGSGSDEVLFENQTTVPDGAEETKDKNEIGEHEATVSETEKGKDDAEVYEKK